MASLIGIMYACTGLNALVAGQFDAFGAQTIFLLLVLVPKVKRLLNVKACLAKLAIASQPIETLDCFQFAISYSLL
jgi:hypothetical protein